VKGLNNKLSVHCL